MSNLLKYKDRLDDVSINWLEDDLQAYCVKKLRQHPNYKKTFALAGDQNAGKRSWQDGAKRRACGMEAGEPDLRLYFLGGRTIFFEMKRVKKKGGVISKKQHDRINMLKELNFFVYVIISDCPDDAFAQMNTILRSLGGLGEGDVTEAEMLEAIVEVAEVHGSQGDGDGRQMDIEDEEYALD